jgi:putative selenate reductase
MRANLAAYAARLARGAAATPPAPAVVAPRPALHFLDCESCNRCTLVCPNAAFFSVAVAPRRVAALDLVVADGMLSSRPTVFETRCEAQWVVDAGLCNACGNCDTFCPESGGPHRVKPRLHRSRESYGADAPQDGVLIEAAGERIAARFDGVEHQLERRGDRWRFGNDAIEAILDDGGVVLEMRLMMAREGQRLEVARFHGLRAIAEAVLREVNPVSAALGHPGDRSNGAAR